MTPLEGGGGVFVFLEGGGRLISTAETMVACSGLLCWGVWEACPLKSTCVSFSHFEFFSLQFSVYQLVPQLNLAFP